MKGFGWVFVFCLLVSTASAQKPSDPVLKSAQLPTYPVLARTAGVVGDMDAEFTLDSEGNVTSVEITSGHPLLKRVTEENIRTWKFKLPTEGGMDGRRFKTRFSYKLSGRWVPESKVPKLTVTFDSFDHVEITSDQQGEPTIRD